MNNLDIGTDLAEVRRIIAKENMLTSLFSFVAAVAVLLTAYAASGENATLISDSLTAMLILLFLFVFQGVYYGLIEQKRFRVSPSANFHSVLSAENTYFVAFGATSASCVYIVATLGKLSNIGDALAASAILLVLLVIQVVYGIVTARLKRNEGHA